MELEFLSHWRTFFRILWYRSEPKEKYVLLNEDREQNLKKKKECKNFNKEEIQINSEIIIKILGFPTGIT